MSPTWIAVEVIARRCWLAERLVFRQSTKKIPRRFPSIFATSTAVFADSRLNSASAEMNAFVRVIERGSFAAAAGDLG
jgi:hypothetical protein